MHRCFISPERASGEVVTLDAGESHHAAVVMRLRADDRVTVFDGQGNELDCEVESIHRREVQLRVMGRRSHPRPAGSIVLAQGITKPKSMDFIVQKATELGVSHLVPVICERTVAHGDKRGWSARLQKWRATAIEAIKQCGCPWLPEISSPVLLTDHASRESTNALRLIASLRPDAQHPHHCLEEYLESGQESSGAVEVWIGPEGDFSPAEEELIRQVGARPISLGTRTLRSETAALYCLAILNYEFQRRLA